MAWVWLERAFPSHIPSHTYESSINCASIDIDSRTHLLAQFERGICPNSIQITPTPINNAKDTIPIVRLFILFPLSILLYGTWRTNRYFGTKKARPKLEMQRASSSFHLWKFDAFVRTCLQMLLVWSAGTSRDSAPIRLSIAERTAGRVSSVR